MVSAIYLLCLQDKEPSEQAQELLRCSQKTDDWGREAILVLAGSHCEATNH